MRILFMGTPDFASASLEALYASGHEVCGVFTQPDKPKNRGMKLEQSPVKKLALEHDTPVFQPVKLRDGTAMDIIRSLAPDLIAVVAYGRILPQDILDYPKYGCINIHGSILPKYRGSAPIQWSVINGDKTAGVTSMYMAAEMDAGDIIFIRETEVGEYETSGELFDRLKDIGASLLVETVDAIERGEATRTAQDHSAATLAPPLTKDLSPVDWSKGARAVCDQIRGLDPWPAATAVFSDKTYKLFRAVMGNSACDHAPGTIIAADKNGLEIACADGSVIIKEIQAPGGKRMPTPDYLRGHSL